MIKPDVTKEDLKLFASSFKGKDQKQFLLSKLEQVLDAWCKKADRDIFIMPPENIDDHINYLIDEIQISVREYAKLIHSGKKQDEEFVKLFPQLMKEVGLN
tara:strand:+ start:358 stop:660 length:303 start_codon:yes stop_codon:yes gene_type:complete